MNESKPMWQSKTVLSSLVVVVISLLTTLGIVKPGEVNAEEATVNLLAIVQGVAGLFAIYGRVTAKTKVKAPGISMMLISFLMFSLVLGGCQDLGNISKSPQAEVKAAIVTLDNTAKALSQAVDAGWLKGKDKEHCQLLVGKARGLIHDWAAYVIKTSKRPSNADVALAVLEELKVYLKKGGD